LPRRFWRERHHRPRLQVEAEHEHGAAARVADIHAPAGQILNDLVAHRDFQFTNVLGRVCARVPQAGKVLALVVAELPFAVGEVEEITRHRCCLLVKDRFA
jgi:hypothetical protein